jgi:type 1 glutamine amidotransferase
MLYRITLILAVLLAPLGRAAEPPPPIKVVMYSGSVEYKSAESLAKLKSLLEEKHNCKVTLHVVEEKGTTLTGIEDLDTADVAVFFTRRVSLADDQLARVKKFLAAGKGVVGVRTASHGFQTWLKFDPEILGGSYNNHYGKDATAAVTPEEKNKSHPLLAGVKPFATEGKLYKNPTLAGDVVLLLTAKAGEVTEPVAWARDAKPGERGRVVYTSLGVPADFDRPDFQTLLTNAVRWTAGRDR